MKILVATPVPAVLNSAAREDLAIMRETRRLLISTGGPQGNRKRTEQNLRPAAKRALLEKGE